MVEPYKATGANIVWRRKDVVDMHAGIPRQEYRHTHTHTIFNTYCFIID